MRRRYGWWLAGLASLAALAFAMLLLSKGPASGEVAFHKVRAGMTRAQVQAVIGMPSLPPGEYGIPWLANLRTEQMRSSVPLTTVGNKKTTSSGYWQLGDQRIVVFFGEDGRAIFHILGTYSWRPSGFIDVVRNWLDYYCDT